MVLDFKLQDLLREKVVQQVNWVDLRVWTMFGSSSGLGWEFFSLACKALFLLSFYSLWVSEPRTLKTWYLRWQPIKCLINARPASFCPMKEQNVRWDNQPHVSLCDIRESHRINYFSFKFKQSLLRFNFHSQKVLIVVILQIKNIPWRSTVNLRLFIIKTIKGLTCMIVAGDLH